jgi:hypothetical protein
MLYCLKITKPGKAGNVQTITCLEVEKGLTSVVAGHMTSWMTAGYLRKFFPSQEAVV